MGVLGHGLCRQLKRILKNKSLSCTPQPLTKPYDNLLQEALQGVHSALSSRQVHAAVATRPLHTSTVWAFKTNCPTGISHTGWALYLSNRLTDIYVHKNLKQSNKAMSNSTKLKKTKKKSRALLQTVSLLAVERHQWFLTCIEACECSISFCLIISCYCKNLKTIQCPRD